VVCPLDNGRQGTGIGCVSMVNVVGKMLLHIESHSTVAVLVVIESAQKGMLDI
jgi:hypothetical protein